jgi:predicted AAA+ superfamily ATPase
MAIEFVSKAKSKFKAACRMKFICMTSSVYSFENEHASMIAAGYSEKILKPFSVDEFERVKKLASCALSRFAYHQ